MKKIMLLMTLIMIGSFNQLETVASEITPTAKTEITSSEKATSNATIGFTKKTPDKDGFTSKPTGRLPTTGETLGIGVSLLGLLLIIIIFRKDLKNIIINKKNRGEKQ